ncbi:S-layer domain protein [Desulfofarcimen acetoxidans DSM 771]|uniref:S-layer domain protein n=1 Tax=Desulfofarcimen acetoxidans (strain ATCC 49208 / DSM 771 / KCTC 5769 / VKM B-1644 / 5575) TaxID=485916 RepID=C8W4Z7_DESAS|nr:YcdB/YcdC domain-containing protein [Desulfofarcimen acetoxidans]ACV61349.1 S-layer domain protein [Desulfofarcimen acetoxidans DSM 771]
MRRKAFCFSAVLLFGSLLMSTAASAEQTASQIVIKQVTVTEAKKLPPASEEKKDSPRISEDEALKIIKSAFPEIIGESKPDMQLDFEDYHGRNVWRINNYERMYHGPGMPAGYDASLDADTGEILSMNRRNNTPTETRGIIQKQEAQKIAEQFIQKLQPERFKNLQLQKSPTENYYPLPSLNMVYRFHWARVENGLKIDYDGINVSVDALSGEVASFDMNWRPEVKLPAAGTPVPAKALIEKATNELGMALIYQVPYRNYTGKPPEANLIYQLNTRELMFNAANGKAVDNQGREKDIKDIGMFEDIPKISGVNNPPDSPGQRITVEKARSTAERFFRSLGIEGEVEMGGGGSSMGGPFGNQEFWSFEIVQKDSSRYYPGSQVGIDRATGRVVNYYERGPETQAETGSPKISQEEALAKADSFIKNVAPEYSPYLAPEKNQVDMYGIGNEQGYGFHFYRVVNGIPFPLDGIHIGISSDGKIRDYHCEWHKVSFPAVQNTLAPGEAAGKWLELSPLQLTYFIPREGEKPGRQAILVYRPDNDGFSAIDALTGKPVAYDGQPVNKTSGSGYDYKQSWAAQYLEILAGSGILPSPEQFSPTGAVKKRDAARLIIAAMGNYYDYDEKREQQFLDINPEDPDFKAIQAGAILGVYDEGGNFNPEQPFTRLTLARWMVNAMGYAEIAKINNNIASSYKDIASLSATDRNYIGLAQGLGIMRGDETGLFKPSDSVTWEELAAVAINSAPKMRNKSGMW